MENYDHPGDSLFSTPLVGDDDTGGYDGATLPGSSHLATSRTWEEEMKRAVDAGSGSNDDRLVMYFNPLRIRGLASGSTATRSNVACGGGGHEGDDGGDGSHIGRRIQIGGNSKPLTSPRIAAVKSQPRPLL